MIDILIIEDDSSKLSSIKETIDEIHSDLNKNINNVESIIEAKILLQKHQYDIVIIDLVIPLRKGDEPNPDNCTQLLEDLETSPFLNPPLFVIGLTRFQELNDKYSIFFEERLFHLLNYEYNSLEWRNKLKKIIFHLVKQKEDFLSPAYFRYKYDAAFITALYNPEFIAVQSLSSEWKKIPHHDDPAIYYETTITQDGKSKRIVAAFADQMGMVATASLSLKMMIKFRPKYIFLTGITAGIKKQGVNFGDILIADICWDYNNGKIEEFKVKDETGEQEFSNIKFDPEPKSIPLKNLLKNKLLEYSNNKQKLFEIRNKWQGSNINHDLAAFIGPLGSGSQVVASSTKLMEIKSQNRKLVGIEMEAYGLYYACTQLFDSKITPIVIKSICDFGDENKNDEYHKYAAYTSAQFAKEFLFDNL